MTKEKYTGEFDPHFMHEVNITGRVESTSQLVI